MLKPSPFLMFHKRERTHRLAMPVEGGHPLLLRTPVFLLSYTSVVLEEMFQH